MSETVAMTLTDFLLARIAEDETEVSSAIAARPAVESWAAPMLRAGDVETRVLARFGPVRISAECEAKRRLIDWCAPISDSERVPTDRPGVYDRRDVRYVNDDGEDVLRYLALPYANHPDYDEGWRP